MNQRESLEWPYPVDYEKENETSTDVLVLGGGIAGSHAAINAARKGARVIIVDKGATKRSGQGGTGVDHWQLACTNPCCKVTSEEMTKLIVEGLGQYDCGLKRYIQCKESYDTLLDVEKMGVKVRDTDDEFKGADFRDDETKLLFAYDYDNKYTIRVCGHNMKPALYNELNKLGITIYDRVMVTGLLTEGGRQGSKVVGATGVNVRTGEFYIFKAKAIVLCMPGAKRLWDFTEPQGFGSNFHEPTNTGDGYAIAWSAGAEFTMMEESMPIDGNLGYIPYGVGNAHNTWHGCPIVDANGKEIPWVDRDGRQITFEQRFQPALGQKVFIEGGGIGNTVNHYQSLPPRPDPNLPEYIKKGDFVLPLYADLSSMPEHERRAIFGLMVGNEGKTRFSVYDLYTKAGFDPDKDMLQVPVFSPEGYKHPAVWWQYPSASLPWNRIYGGGLIVDWELKTSIEGLYAAGNAAFGFGEHAAAATTGRYAGRKAAQCVFTAPDPVVDRNQVDNQKARVYAPIKRQRGIRWKELNAGISRVMQDFCGKSRNESTLKIGLKLLAEIREGELSTAYAPNPHELMHILECSSLLNVGEIVTHSSLARKASSAFLNFYRLDYPEIDPKEWNKFITIKLADNEIKVGELPLNYYLLPPYARSYEENYEHFVKEVN